MPMPPFLSQRGKPISILTVSTLFPNPVQPVHGIFVETRLRKLIASGAVVARVLAPVPWLPPFIEYGSFGPLRRVPRSLERDGLRIDHPRYVVLPKLGMYVSPFSLYLAVRKCVARLLRGGARVDLIDAHYLYPDGVAAVWAARAFNLPVVITARGTDLNLLPRYLLPRKLIKQTAAAADGLITVCEALKTEFTRLGVAPERVTVLRNGVDLNLFRPMDRNALRRQLGLTRRTLASVGHLIGRKGHHYVIRALTRLPETDLLIVGSGPERAALDQLAKQLGITDRVRFTGPIDQHQLCRIYNACDALVLASNREGWANVLLEAMACGTPVVASAVWGTPEIVTSSAAGVLMPSLDEDGVVAGVTKLFEALPAREATRRYAEGFDWQATTQGQIELFREIVARHAVST